MLGCCYFNDSSKISGNRLRWRQLPLDMADKLLWSWTLEDTKAAMKKYALPQWVEQVLGLLVLSLFLYVSIKYIAPIAGVWFTVLAVLISALGLYLGLKKKKPEKSAEKEAYLKIYNDGIKINLYGFYGFYRSYDIVLETLVVKNIFYSGSFGPMGGIGFIKGLCFKTSNPRMTVKVPLVGLLPDKIIELEKVVCDLKRANDLV